MLPGKVIDLDEGWELLSTEHWLYKQVNKNGKVIISKANESVNLPRETMTIKVFQREFGRELITVRAIYFFHKGPVILLWKSGEYPEEDVDDDSGHDYFKMAEFWWQNHFYKAIQVDQQWRRFSEDEYFKIIISKKANKITGVFIDVADFNNPEAQIARVAIK